MRELKFRAWDTQNKRMIVDFLNYAGWQAHDNLENAWHNKRYVIEQFTGLHDKNGKEIYEGDVIRWGDKLAREQETARTVAVEFRSGCFGIVDGKYFHEFWHYHSDDWTSGELEWGELEIADYFRACLEVIGTIHDGEVQE